MKTLRLLWISTTCDVCGAPGLRVLVPQNGDGSVGGREFPSLCATCHSSPSCQRDTARALLETEGADSIVVSDPKAGGAWTTYSRSDAR